MSGTDPKWILDAKYLHAKICDYEVSGHTIYLCDSSTGHIYKPVAFCDESWRAEAIVEMLKLAREAAKEAVKS